MQFVATKENLLREFTKIQSIVEKRSTRPILANALMQAQGNGVAVYATDLEVGLSSRIEARVGNSGDITAPAKKLSDIVRLLPDDSEVSIEVLENNFLKITCGRIEYKLTGAPREEFPSIPGADDGKKVNMPAGTLSEMIRKTIFGITTEETRYALNGAQLSIEPGRIRMVTTDAHRLAFVEYPFEEYDGEGMDILIPRKTVSELKVLIGDDLETVSFTGTDNHLFFNIGHRTLDSRTLEGQFPNYEKVLPKDNDKTVLIDRYLFGKAIDRVALLSHETSKAIRLAVSSGMMLISSSHPEVGEAKEEIEVQYEGPELKIGFNSKYLKDFIETLSTDQVALDLKDESAAGLMRPITDEPGDYKYVVMPMRIS